MIARILAVLSDSMEMTAVAGESVLGTIKIAVMPIAKVFTMCFLGLLMASKYVNILPPSGRKLLNGVITIISLCALFFLTFSKDSNFDFDPLFTVGLLAFASLLDLFSAWTSRHLYQNASVVCFVLPSKFLSFVLLYIERGLYRFYLLQVVHPCERCSWHNLRLYNRFHCCYHYSSTLPLFQVYNHTNRSWLDLNPFFVSLL